MIHREQAGQRGKLSTQDARRNDLLERQKQSRKGAWSMTRKLLLESGVSMDDVDVDPTQTEDDGGLQDAENGAMTSDDIHQDGVPTHKSIESDMAVDSEAQEKPQDTHRSIYKNHTMMPEWVTEIPLDLRSKWLIFPRPSGIRCLVISGRGETLARTKNGRILKRHPSLLPNGCMAHGARGGATILDCILDEVTSTYYVLDVLCWNRVLFYDCSTDMRQFWIRSKLAEIGGIGELSRLNPFRFLHVPSYDCTCEAFAGVYGHDFGFIKDGILFYHKEAMYTPGPSPLVLVWMDESCSKRYYTQIASDAPNHTKRLEGATVWTAEQIMQAIAAGM
jgi:snurportin-1